MTAANCSFGSSSRNGVGGLIAVTDATSMPFASVGRSIAGDGSSVRSMISASGQKLSGKRRRSSSSVCPSRPQLAMISCSSASVRTEHGRVSGDLRPKLALWRGDDLFFAGDNLLGLNSVEGV